MRKIIFLALPLISILLTSCLEEDTGDSASKVCPTPANSVSTAIRAESYGDFLLDFDTGQLDQYWNCPGDDLMFTDETNFEVPCGLDGGIADIGNICLDSVTSADIPGLLSITATAYEDNAYIVKTQDGAYWAFALKGFRVSADNGGIIGADIIYKRLE